MISGFILYFLVWFIEFLVMSLFALTQSRHRRATGMAELSPPRVKRVRLGACLLLLLAFVLAVYGEGGGFGFLLWVGEMSMAALLVAAILALRPSLLAPLAGTLMERVPPPCHSR